MASNFLIFFSYHNPKSCVQLLQYQKLYIVTFQSRIANHEIMRAPFGSLDTKFYSDAFAFIDSHKIKFLH